MSTQDKSMGMDAIEPTDEQLKALAGGKLSDAAAETCVDLMYLSMERGLSKEQFVAEYIPAWRPA